MAQYTLTHASPGRCEFDMASPSFACRDRNGHLSMRGMSKLLLDATTIALDNGCTPSGRDLGKDNYRFLQISEKYIVFQNFRTKFSSAEKLQKYHVTYTVSDVTPRIVCIRCVFSDTETGSWFLKSETKSVAVNSETHRSEKLLNWYYKSVSNHVDPEHTTIMTRKQDAFVFPGNAFKTTLETRYSDLDSNLHVNVAEYYEFCSDAASEASLSGYYRHFTSDIVKYPLMQTEATFLGECGPREQIVVYTWQDENDVSKLYFAIYLKKMRIFQACFIYNSTLTQDKAMSSL